MLAILSLLGCGAPPPQASDEASSSSALSDCPDPVRMYEDEDGDGYGVFAPPAPYEEGDDPLLCPGTPGWTERTGDCDDADPGVHLGAADTCGDAVDPDCVPGCAPVELVATAGAVALGDRAARVHLGGGVDAADIDGDGDLEILALGYGDLRAYHEEGGLGAVWTVNGTNVTAVGDLDGDGRSEIAVGEPALKYCTGACDGYAYGGVWLVSGPGWTRGDLPEIRGGGYQDEMGGAVAAGGDLDGDGRAEVLVGAWGERAVFAWRAGDDVTPLLGATHGFGRALAGGDVDGDGADDALVASDTGVHVFHGPLGAELAEADAGSFVEAGSWSGDLVVADLDGDGHLDVAPPPDGSAGGVNRVRVFAGPIQGSVGAGSASATLTFGNDGYTVVTAAGDLDGDGVADLVLGAPTGGLVDRGVVYAVLGPVEGARWPLDDADRRWIGEAPEARLGQSLAVADLDGDGRAGIVAGAAHWGDATGISGGVHLLLWEP